jgi:hypothetical protein
MEYMDDPPCILDCPHTMDSESKQFIICADNTDALPVPRLPMVKLKDLRDYQLMFLITITALNLGLV